MSAVEYIIGAFVIIISLIIIFVVLFQQGRRAGISGAISGGADTFLSKNKARTADALLARWTKYIALLFFIANIHSSVNSIDDYGNMLVVIDDPSSNLDYENTIRIADIISDINSIVDVSQDIKTIVLTHDTVLRDELIKQQNAKLITI